MQARKKLQRSVPKRISEEKVLSFCFFWFFVRTFCRHHGGETFLFFRRSVHCRSRLHHHAFGNFLTAFASIMEMAHKTFAWNSRFLVEGEERKESLGVVGKGTKWWGRLTVQQESKSIYSFFWHSSHRIASSSVTRRPNPEVNNNIMEI